MQGICVNEVRIFVGGRSAIICRGFQVHYFRGALGLTDIAHEMLARKPFPVCHFGHRQFRGETPRLTAWYACATLLAAGVAALFS
jgi:hypothetical protein